MPTQEVELVLTIGAGLIIAAMFLIYWQLRELHRTMNSRLDELIRTAKLLARAEGFKEGQEDHLKQLREFKE